jgi:hypothetical protein
VSSVAVAISVLAIASKVGKEGCTTFKLGVGGGDTSVDYVDAGTFTSAGVVGVRRTASLEVDVGDTGQAPCRRALSGVGPLLDAVDLAKVGLDNGILLDVFDLFMVSICVSNIDRYAYAGEIADQVNNVVSHVGGESTKVTKLVDMSGVLLEKLQGSVDELLEFLVLALNNVASGNGGSCAGNDHWCRSCKCQRQKGKED